MFSAIMPPPVRQMASNADLVVLQSMSVSNGGVGVSRPDPELLRTRSGHPYFFKPSSATAPSTTTENTVSHKDTYVSARQPPTCGMTNGVTTEKESFPTCFMLPTTAVGPHGHHYHPLLLRLRLRLRSASQTRAASVVRGAAHRPLEPILRSFRRAAATVLDDAGLSARVTTDNLGHTLR